MTGLVRRGLGVASLVLAALLVIPACSTGDVEPVEDIPSIGQPADDPEPADGPGPTETPLPVDQPPAPGVPPECAEAYPWAPGPADLATLTLLPADWPDPPGGSTLCTVNAGGVTEMAAYVTDLPVEQVLSHYESQLQRYQPVRTTGEENGTGYDALEGAEGALTVQVREAEHGFLLAFISTEGF